VQRVQAGEGEINCHVSAVPGAIAFHVFDVGTLDGDLVAR
jgi:hypothetical protein